MMLEVEAATGEQAKDIAKEVGYVLDEGYSPVPLKRDNRQTWILRGERGDKIKDAPGKHNRGVAGPDPRILEWSDAKMQTCKPY
jgi:hypothetical protein